MADPISPSPVAPERAQPQHAGADRADLRPENIQDAVIRPGWEFAGRNSNGRRISGPSCRTDDQDV